MTIGITLLVAIAFGAVYGLVARIPKAEREFERMKKKAFEARMAAERDGEL